MADLVLHVRSKYFRQIASGEKKFEYRLANEYWSKRIVCGVYDRVVIWDAYKKRSDEAVLIFPWRGYRKEKIRHEFFGKDPVEVFAIALSGSSDSPSE